MSALHAGLEGPPIILYFGPGGFAGGCERVRLCGMAEWGQLEGVGIGGS